MEDQIKKALNEGGIDFGQVVEVDPIENDWLITAVKEKESVKVRNKEKGVARPDLLGHSVPPGKSIIQRLEDLADSDFKRYMNYHPVKPNPSEDWKSEVNKDELKAAGIVLNHLDSRVEGICECLAVMKNTSRGVEYEAVLDRYQNEITVGEKRPNG